MVSTIEHKQHLWLDVRPVRFAKQSITQFSVSSESIYCSDAYMCHLIKKLPK